MNAAGRLGFRHALDAVYPRFEFEPGENVPAADRGGRLFKSAETGFREVKNLETPPSQCGIFLVHAKEFRREQCRLVASCPRADLEDGITPVIGILRQECQLDPLFQRRKPLAQRAKFVLGKHFQLRIFTRLGEIREGGKLVAGAAERVDPVDDRGQLAIFFRRFCEIGARETRAGQRIAQLRVATEELI